MESSKILRKCLLETIHKSKVLCYKNGAAANRRQKCIAQNREKRPRFVSRCHHDGQFLINKYNLRSQSFVSTEFCYWKKSTLTNFF